MQDYKSLCAAVTICGTLININAVRLTTFWPTYTNSSTSWAKSSLTCRCTTKDILKQF